MPGFWNSIKQAVFLQFAENYEDGFACSIAKERVKKFNDNRSIKLIA